MLSTRPYGHISNISAELFLTLEVFFFFSILGEMASLLSFKEWASQELASSLYPDWKDQEEQRELYSL